MEIKLILTVEEVIRQLDEAFFPGFREHGQSIHGSLSKAIGFLPGALQAEEGGVGGFFRIGVFAGGFTEFWR